MSDGDKAGTAELDKAVPVVPDATAMAGLPVVLAGLPVAVAGAVSPVPVPAKATGPAAPAATGQQSAAGAVAPGADPTGAVPAVGADAGGAAGQGPPADHPGTGQAPVVLVPGAPTGPTSGSVSSDLATAVQQIVAAKTSDPAAEPTVATVATGQGVAAPAPTVATSVPVLPGAPGSPQATAAQLAPALFAVHRAGVGGTHRMTVDITPEALGPVRLTVSLQNGQLQVLLAGSSDLSREALRAALPELRKLVEGAGITAGTFDVQPDQSDAGRPWSGPNGFFGDAQGGRSGAAPGQSAPGHATPDHAGPGAGTPDLSTAASVRRNGHAATHSLDLNL